MVAISKHLIGRFRERVCNNTLWLRSQSGRQSYSGPMFQRHLKGHSGERVRNTTFRPLWLRGKQPSLSPCKLLYKFYVLHEIEMSPLLNFSSFSVSVHITFHILFTEAMKDLPYPSSKRVFCQMWVHLHKYFSPQVVSHVFCLPPNYRKDVLPPTGTDNYF